ncbi:MAG TPA: adenylate/guanylate cyclase domain-containing protein, partial [Mycobacterium sp.]
MDHPGHARPRLPGRGHRDRTRRTTDTDRADHPDCQRVSAALRRTTVDHRPRHHHPAGLVTMAPTTPIPSTPFPLPTTPAPMTTNYGCSTSPGMARASLEASFRLDVRPILPTITAPTLVIHAREDPVVPVQEGRYLADHIPGARYLEVDGADHPPYFTEPDKILTGIEEFLTGSHAAPAQSHRALRTLLFTDIVASTQHAAETGDERWRAVLHRFGEITADLAERFGGTVVKSTGDGHLATFDGPTQAIRCAEALHADTETLGIRIRSAIHTGECELLDADIGGIAVHVAARILGQAGAGEILVSRTVRD